MHYKYLTEVGEHYATETSESLLSDRDPGVEGPCLPLRRVALLSLVSALLKVKTEYERLEQQQPQATPEEKLRARAVYARQLRHLQNQGGVLKADGSLDWGATDSLVIYDTDAAARDLTKLRFQGGLLYTDDACTKLFDTSNLSTFFSKLGFAIYVMSEEGNIHAANHAVGMKHHSSLLSAAKAAGAGEMKVEKGKLVWISNKSGHYTPSTPHFIQTLHQLQKKNINLDSVRVQFHTATGKTQHPSVSDFLASLKPEEDYYHAKMIGYINSYPYKEIETFLQSNGWDFPTKQEYHQDNKKGVVTIWTRQKVDHKLVCQFFKLKNRKCDPTVNLDLLQKKEGR